MIVVARHRISVALCCGLLSGIAISAFAAEPVRFNRDIRPILSDHCFACHGFDAKKREADLRLDTPEGATGARAEGAAIVPGKPDESSVWKRIVSDNPDERMPPPAAHKDLNESQKGLLRRWIEEGAVYEKHWAFEPPVKATPPSDAPHPVDAFLNQRMAAEGMTPGAATDRATLLRRLSFALTGLPPTPEEVAAFVADPSEQAYAAMVERYLQSPHFGEEQARYWLDVARYADTHGLHLDNEREMWAYRDWVVRAFNENLPFDQFTLWQLAGDMLPEPSNDQLVATGFNRCNVTTSEGGALDDEFRYRYAVDRTSTVMEAWMGLTGGCAVCHDHKYDPLTTREFYSLYAFFNQAADPPMDKNISYTEPFIRVYTSEQKAALTESQAREAVALNELRRIAAEAKASAAAAAPLEQPMQVTDVLFDDAFPFGAGVRTTSRNPSVWHSVSVRPSRSGSRSLYQASSYFMEEDIDLSTTPLAVPDQAAFEAWVYPDPDSPPKALALVLKQGGERVAYWGVEGLAGTGIGLGSKNVYLGPIPKPGEWNRVTFTAESLGLKAGEIIKGFSVQQSGGAAWWDRWTVHGVSTGASDPRRSFEAWWKGAGKPLPEVPGDLQEILKAGPKEDVPPEKRTALEAFYLAHVARPITSEIETARRIWEDARVAREQAELAAPGTFIYRDQPQPRQSFVMLRGQYDKPGEEVQPGVPAVLPPLPKREGDARPTRLDLARWLVSPEQPLVARVTVNRIWQQVFGLGLVKTSHDLGSQGTPPSHPELLDWLAVTFREGGWDVKGLIRLLVTSQAFQRDSRVTPETYQRDPENRFYARGPRFRLDAEQIRDNALFVSGLMDPRMGGRGAMPYQPEKIWEPVGYENSNTRFYLQDHGTNLYRRSIYCFIKRTAPPPFLTNFDGPNREQSCTRRERSNTPLQALQLMNDVQHFEAARALAERVLENSEIDDLDRLRRLFLIVVARYPDEQETKWLSEALAAQRQHYSTRLADAEAVVRSGESTPSGVAPVRETAAWTLVANLVLNLDETLTRN